MSSAALEALVRHQRALIAALDVEDAAGIVEATAAMDETLVRIRAGAAPRGPEAKALADEATRLADAARVRVNVLADMTGRRLDRLATTGRTAAPVQTYGRNARFARA